MTFHEMTCDECMLGKCMTDDPSKHGTCKFGLAYVEGSSWIATEVSDYCYIGGLHNKPISIDDKGHDDLDPEHAVAFGFELNFGCQTEITGFFRTQLADGILAMDNSPNSFWHQMYVAGKMQEELFSLCYTRQPHAERNGTEAGAMTLGGSDDRLHLNPMVFSKHEDVWGLNYGVLLRKIHLREGGGGDSVNATQPGLKVVTIDIDGTALNEGGVIIESGTTDTYMTKQMLEPFRAAWSTLTDVVYDNKVPLSWSHEEIQKLPTILFQFEGADDLNKKVPQDRAINLAGSTIDPDHPYDVVVAMPPNHYMEYNERDKHYTPRFYMDENPAGISTLGANAMMGHDVLFDAKNHRIGWAESNCDYSHLLKEAGFDKKGSHQRPAPAPTPNTPSSGGSQYSSSSRSAGKGTCSSIGCRASFVLVVAFFGTVLVLRRQSGRLGEITRGVLGGKGYRGMPAEEVMGNDSELELRVSYADNSYDLS